MPRAGGPSVVGAARTFPTTVPHLHDYLDSSDSPQFIVAGRGGVQRSALSHAGPISIGCCVFGLTWLGETNPCHTGLKADCWTVWVDCQASLTQSVGWHLKFSPKVVEIEFSIHILVAEERSLLRLLRSRL